VSRSLAIIVIWLIVLGGAAAAYKFFILDANDGPGDDSAQASNSASSGRAPDSAPDKDPKHTGRTGPSVVGKQLPKVKLALDSFSGYAIFRSPDFKKRLATGLGAFDFEYVDDDANYEKRMKSIESGETPLAVFTIDALITQTKNKPIPPASIVLLIDETRGADAMVSWTTGLKDIDGLNNNRAKVVLTEASPSETLFRVVRSHFDLQKLPPRKDYLIAADPKKGARDVFEKFQSWPRTDPAAFVLWEPYVSQARALPGAHVLVDSSQFKGYIVDVLVVQRDYLLAGDEKTKKEHRAQVEKVIATYLDTLHDLQKSASAMARLVKVDAAAGDEKLTDEDARQVVKGIWWKNSMENYDHLGLLRPDETKGLQPISDMINRITTALDQTREPGAAWVALPRPDKLYDDDFLRALAERRPRFHGDEKILEERVAGQLTDWKDLMPIASLQFEPIRFGGSTNDELDDEEKSILKDLEYKLKAWPTCYLRVEGHTKPGGDLDANRELAMKRANAVKDYLVTKLNFSENRIKAIAGEPGPGKFVTIIALQQR
jgi:outer membrane protein OmpA-like peptidoglycan-associated protein